MLFEEGIGAAVADVVADICKFAGVALDKEQCEAQVAAEGTDIHKTVYFKFVESGIVLQVDLRNHDGVDRTYTLSVYGDKDVYYDDFGLEEYDADTLKTKLAEAATGQAVIISEELKSDIAGFIEHDEYSSQGSISYKL
jgi:hypothetical protein